MGKFHISTQILQETVLFSGKIYTAGHIFIRPLFVTVATNFKSVMIVIMFGVGEEERGGKSGNEAERGITSKRGHGTNKSSEMVTYRERIVRSLDRFFWWGAWCWWQKWWWLYNEQDLIFPPHEITVVASHPILHHHIVMLEILYQLFINLIAAAQCCGCENCQTLLWTWTKWPGEKVAFFGFFDV